MVESSLRGSIVYLVALMALIPGGRAVAADWPSTVVAKYDVSFAGFRIGPMSMPIATRWRERPRSLPSSAHSNGGAGREAPAVLGGMNRAR